MDRGLFRSFSLALVCASLSLLACERTVAACPKDPAATAKELVELFAKSTLSADSGAMLLGAPHSQTLAGEYWQLTSTDCPLEVVFPARNPSASLPDAELRLLPAARLMLRELERQFGPGETVYSSKTSSVLFRVQATGSAAPVLVFARINTSKPKPDSPVLTLVLRRDPTTK